MANVANTNNTGPASKDAISGGRKLSIQTKEGDTSGPNLDSMGTSSEEARRTIMGMRVQSTPFLTATPEATRSKLQSQSGVPGIPNKDFKPTR